MNAYYDTFKTSFGPFSIAVDERGVVLATAFGERRALAARLGPARLGPDKRRTAEARSQILAYCRGERREFRLPLAPRGTAFQQRVWQALAAIPCGATASYAELARRLGKPGAARAVGAANGANPICLITPCHRIIGSDGSLTGFAFGTALKQRLLAHEREMAAPSLAA